MVVTGAPLWSLMTRRVVPFAGLLTATRPFFPAERITWPAGGPPQKKSFQHFTNASSTFTVNTVGGIWWFLWTVQGSSSPSAEYCTAVTATWWGCSFISISEEESRKIRRVPSLYPAATHALCLLEAGLQHTQPQDWPTETYRVWSSYRVHTKGLKSCSRWINCYSLKDCWWFLA